MTSKIPEDHRLYDKSHRAIVLTAEARMTVPDGAKVTGAVTDYLKSALDAGELLPVWVRFTDLQDREIFDLQPFFAPADRDFLNGLILAIEGVDKHMTVSSFSYKARQFPKKDRKRATGKPLRRNDGEGAAAKASDIAIPDPNCLPLSLRFFACEEALAEAKKLGEIYDRWPFFGFCRDDLKTCSEKLVAEFAERYPYLAEVDKVLDGRLTEVIMELGKHPYQKPFELRRFWKSVRHGGVKSWKQLANELLCEIAQGAGNPFRHYEETEAPTTAAAYLAHDDRPRRDRAFMTRYSRFSK
ncbi:hypothetical protein FHT77_000439 [Rhizobium sp. BK181]|uniref:hypothetical protein n=1 Tax=Rhizobium sp. BK181 TaxID=2587072 RepID=UPI0016144837|nr:hypothetical protein [Rhizobium sp. BK181]MBB3314597.1 hypothetical protein [Rhizobium sp. BK181]